MKILYVSLIFIACIFSIENTIAQTTIFTETMGTVSATTTIAAHEAANGFDNDVYTMTQGDATNPGDLRATSASAGYTGASGSANVWLTSSAGEYGFAIEGIDVAVYYNMTVQFGYRKESATALPALAVDYWNGSAWVNIPFTFNEAATAAAGWYLSPSITIPVGAQIDGLKLRWVKTGSIACRLDDIVLSGTMGSCSAPATQASNITFTNIALYAMTVNWVRGDGNNILVVGHAGSPVDADPVDGTDYTASAAFGSGTQIGTGNFVVYKGTGTSVNLTGLTQNTTYYFKVYEYNCSGVFSVYNTADIVTNNETTLALCTDPDLLGVHASNMTFSNVTSASMQVSWTQGDANYYIVLAKQGSAVDAVPVDGVTYNANAAFGTGSEIGTGNFVVYKGNGSSVNVTGLQISTSYHFAVFDYCASGGNGTEVYSSVSLTGNKVTSAYMPSKCFEIESILVDGCDGSNEGRNEMVRFTVGPSDLNVNDLEADWPSNPWQGVCTSPTATANLAVLNDAILGCGLLVEPPGGIIPAGATVIFMTSVNFTPIPDYFQNLGDTIYVIFQCDPTYPTYLGGHFGNYDAAGGGRTLILNQISTGCSDTVTYQRDELLNQAGNPGAQDGGAVNFDWDGTDSYFNNGCVAPFDPVGVTAVTASGQNKVCMDGTIAITGTIIGSYSNLYWSGGIGTFADASAINTTYTPDPTESGEVILYLNATNSCGNVNDTVTIYVYQYPVPVVTDDLAICDGNTTDLTASGGTGYVWSNSSTNATINVSPSSSTMYYVTVSNPACASKDSVYVTVNMNPVVNLGADQDACINQIVTLDAGNGFTYNWSTTESTQTIDVTGTGTYSVTITDGNTCTDRDSVTITYHNPVVNLGVDLVECEGDNNQLDAGSWAGYLWSDATTGQTITPAVSGTYSVTITDAYSCQDVDSIEVTINPNPTVELGSNINDCAGNTVVLDAGSGFSYIWTGGSTNQTLPVTSSGTYAVTITDSNLCTATDNITVTIHALPVFTLSTTQASCGGSDGSATITGGSYTYQWDANAGNQTTATVSNLPAGNYSVTISDTYCSVDTSVNITELGAPTVSITTTDADNTICAGESVTITASGADTYSWNSGQTTNSITITPSTSFNYIVEGISNGCSGFANVNLTVNPVPVVDLGPDTLNCGGASIQLDAGPFASFQWSNGDNTQTTSITTTGQYWVSVTNTYNCADIDTINVSISPAININLGGNIEKCVGQSVILDAGAGTYQYNWNTGANTQTITVSYDGNPTQPIAVTVTDNNGCTGIGTATVSFYQNPSVELGQNQAACEGSSITLDANTVSGYSYNWSTGETTSLIVVTTSGSYSVTVTDSHSCTTIDQVDVTISANPSVNLGSDYSICEGLTTTLSTNISSAQSYQWSNGATTSSINVAPGPYSVTVTLVGGCYGSDNIIIGTNYKPSISMVDWEACAGNTVTLDPGTIYAYSWSTGDTTHAIDVTTSGTYSVTATNSCGTDTASSVVTINELPVAVLPADTTIDENTTAILDAGNPGYNYEWSTGATSQTISVSTQGVYSVTITTPKGCVLKDSTVVIVVVEPPAILHPYNTFTPNDDQINDTWVIDNIDKYPYHSVSVYNRNGNLVFSSTNYMNNWNGKYNDKDLPAATYYYIIDPGDGSKILKGFVAIVR